MSKMKRCPFCGGTAEVDYEPDWERYCIYHFADENPECPIAHYIGQALGPGYKSEEEAVEAWNERW